MTPDELQRQLCEAMEIQEADLPKQNGTYAQNCHELDAFKTWIKQKRRLLAKKHHPDVGGDEALFKRINAFVDLVMKVQPVNPQPVVRGTWVVYTWGNRTTWTTTSSSTNF